MKNSHNLIYHSKGKDYLIVDKKEIWSRIGEDHKDFIRGLIEGFNAEVKFIKSGDKVFFNKRKKL